VPQYSRPWRQPSNRRVSAEWLLEACFGSPLYSIWWPVEAKHIHKRRVILFNKQMLMYPEIYSFLMRPRRAHAALCSRSFISKARTLFLWHCIIVCMCQTALSNFNNKSGGQSYCNTKCSFSSSTKLTSICTEKFVHAVINMNLLYHTHYSIVRCCSKFSVYIVVAIFNVDVRR
jgi:hypothetical protein